MLGCGIQIKIELFLHASGVNNEQKIIFFLA